MTRERPRHVLERLLCAETPAGWAAQAVARLDETLRDHAHCEKKASVSALALIHDYPDDSPLVEALSRLCEEEVGHFREVHALLRRRDVPLGRDPGDPYAQELLRLVRRHPAERKLDRLLVAAFIEARSAERFELLQRELESRGDAELAAFFRRLGSSEVGHAALFLELARRAAGSAAVDARVAELARAEAALVRALPHHPRIH